MTANEIAHLHQEIARLQKALTAARRAAPEEPVADYTFASARGPCTLADLFGDRDDLLVVHNMGTSCPYCTLWADGLAGVAGHLESRAAFVVSSPDDPETQAAFAAKRGWPFRMVSIAGTSFARDLGYEPQPGKFGPGVSAFHRKPDGAIVRTGHAPFGPGDEFCAVWHLFDLLAKGADGWTPKYAYPEPAAIGRAD